MGGPGSGDYYRWIKRTTKEELKRIDIRYMKMPKCCFPIIEELFHGIVTVTLEVKSDTPCTRTRWL